MSLFQNSVVEKFSNTLKKEVLLEKWNIYKNHFQNSTIQENIRNSKEEQYQGEFLIDLFVNVLGYTKNPTPNFNLTTELKNEKDSKKADGGIIINDIVVGVIELKGTNTIDLNKIEVQAFGYKNNQKDCIYVVTSNFEKLRFYIDNAIEYIEFNLFQLSEKEFKLLYLCLSFETISKNIPKKIKDESLSQEDKITKELYKDYSIFKRELFNDLVLKNPQFEPLELFKKSQKLLDRFLFLFFAEDRQLLPPNSVRLILYDWKDLKEKDVYIPLYERYKKYFEYLNTGYKGKRYDVFAYNGGLFKPDEILDSIEINDELLYKHTLKISEYDFESEVDVNILGHIFENSLNELDEMKIKLSTQKGVTQKGVTPMDITPMGHDPLKSEKPLSSAINPMGHDPLESEKPLDITPMGHDPLEKQISKRKKDGVFYTPKYITKYIVENTVGKMCKEKKIELEINEEDFYTDKKRTNKTKQPLLDKLTQYRNWLLQLTIIDPACGSGAFLNQALNFLIEQHSYIDELQAKLFGDEFILSDVEKSILENNLYGVDLNEESVEIAKLSLWLRTAQPNRKLNDLNNNIKCGNSLIDDITIAADKAFNWQKEFPQIFKEKNKKAYHLVFTTHNSRTSQRMIDFNVKKGPAIELNLNEEIELTKIFKNIIIENNYKCLAYNICKDHVHLIIICEEDEVTGIVQKMKSISSKLFHRLEIPMGHDPLEHKNHLWSQKFFYAQLDELIWADISPKPGYIATDSYLENAINYIKTNRYKHGLMDSKELKSIIHSFIVDIDKAFSIEYNGGFDVVIGNPPYVQIQSMGTISEDLKKMNYKTYEKTGDLYCLFYELGNLILKENGLLGFITSNKWLRASYGKTLRNYLLQYTQPIELIDLGSGIFESATVDSNILIFEKSKNNNSFIGLDISKEKIFIDFTIYDNKKVEINPKVDDIWSISNPIENQIKNKIEKIGTPLKDWNIKINRGILTGFNDAFIIDEVTRNELIKEDFKSSDIIFPLLRGRDINRYNSEYQNLYLINSHNGYNGKPEINIQDYPAIKKHLDKYYIQLEKRGDKGKTPYNLRNCAYIDDFLNENLFYPDICQRLSFTKVKSMFSNNTGYYLKTSNNFLLSILNSNLINYYYKKISAQLGETGIRSFTIYIEMIPIPKISDSDQQPFIEKADLMLSLNKVFQILSQKFQRTISREHAHLEDNLPKKLQEWYLLSYAEFVKELEKKKIKLTLSQKSEWEDYFTQEATKILALKNKIDATDKEIDKMVYELYGLSDEEIKIVEKS